MSNNNYKRLIKNFGKIFKGKNDIYLSSDVQVSVNYLGFKINLGHLPAETRVCDVILQCRQFLDPANTRWYYCGELLHRSWSQISEFGTSNLVLSAEVIDHTKLRGLTVEVYEAFIKLPYNPDYYTSFENNTTALSIIKFYFRNVNILRMYNPIINEESQFDWDPNYTMITIDKSINDLVIVENACNRYAFLWRHFLGIRTVEHQSFASQTINESWDLCESMVLVMWLIAKAQDYKDVVFTIMITLKLVTKNSIKDNMIQCLDTILTYLPDMREHQSADILDSTLNIIDDYEKFKNSEFFKNCYCLLAIILAKVIDSSEDDYEIVQNIREHGIKLIKNSADFPILILKSITFIFKRCWQAYLLGSWQPIVYDVASLEAWVCEVRFLDEKYPYYSNLRPHGLSEQEFDVRLDIALRQGQSIIKLASKNVLKFYSFYMDKLKKFDAELLVMRANRSSREDPFAIEMYGPPGVGKTTLVPFLANIFAQIRDLPTGEQYIYTRNPDSEYHDNFKTFMHTWFVDDICKNKPDRVIGVDNSLSELISIINSSTYMAVMPDVDSKGKFPISPEFVVVTSNAMDLHANTYLTSPYALFRRFKIIVDVTVKEEFADPAGKLDTAKISQWQGVPNWWRFVVKEAYISSTDNAKGKKINENNLVKFKDAYLEDSLGRPTDKLEFTEIEEFIKFFSTKVMTHFDLQKSKSGVKDYLKELKFCKVCKTWNCTCTVPEIEIQSESRLTNSLSQLEYVYYIMEICILTMLSVYGYYWRKMVLEGMYDKFNLGKYSVFIGHILVFVACCSNPITFCLGIIFILSSLICVAQDAILNRLESTMFLFTKVAAESIMKSLRHAVGQYFSQLCAYQVAIISLITFGSSFMVYKTIFSAIGKIINMMMPPVVQKGELKDLDDKNIWHKDKIVLTPANLSRASQNYARMRKDEIVNRLSNNVARIFIYESDDRTISTNIFSPGGNAWLINRHTLEDVLDKQGLIKIKVKYGEGDRLYTHETSLDIADLVIIPDSDLILFNLTIRPREKMIKLFFQDNEDLVGNWSGFYLGRTDEGDIKLNSVGKIHGTFNNQFPHLGSQYWSGISKDKTVKGDCGSILIIHDGICAIAGMHSMGIKVNPLINSNTIWSTPINNNAIERFPKYMVEINSPQVKEGTEFQSLHPKAIVNYIDRIDHIGVHGTIATSISNSKTRVAKSPLCDYMLTRGISTKLVAPKFKGQNTYMPYHLWMKAVAYSQSNIPVDVMKVAILDYLSPLLALDTSHIKMLTDREALNGRKGCRYIDGMILSTSPGYPRTGKKRDYVEEDPDELNPDGKKLKPEIEEEYLKILDDFSKGLTSGSIFVTVTKDEPVTQEKNEIGKIRIFNTMPMSFILATRKIFLSLIKFFQENRVESEMAVGINAHSTEWHNILKYLNFGIEPTSENIDDMKVLAGDFKSFDLSMHSDTLYAVKTVILSILSQTWSDEDLIMANTCLTEIIHKYVKVKGELYSVNNSNPSGNPLTVIINCIANSLYMRCVYYAQCYKRGDKIIQPFQDIHRMLTYGDDNIISVGEHSPLNHLIIRDQLAEWNIGYTMADKGAEFTPYISIHEATFLKRKWKYDEHTKHFMAPLAIESIHKMLCIWNYSKNAFDEQMEGVIRSAVFEIFQHGEAKYIELCEIIQGYLDLPEHEFVHPIDKYIVNIDHFCRWKPPTYQEMLDNWYTRCAPKGSELVLPGDESPIQH